MLYCYKCGKKNDEDAEHCIKCGTNLYKSNRFEENLEKFAKEIGERAEKFGKKVEKKVKEFAKSTEGKLYANLKHCSNCNIDLDYDAKYCWKCGNEV
jgi:ribosomal protein L40E